MVGKWETDPPTEDNAITDLYRVKAAGKGRPGPPEGSPLGTFQEDNSLTVCFSLFMG